MAEKKFRFQCWLGNVDEAMMIKEAQQKKKAFGTDRGFVVEMARLVNSGKIDAQLNEVWGKGFDDE